MITEPPSVLPNVEILAALPLAVNVSVAWNSLLVVIFTLPPVLFRLWVLILVVIMLSLALIATAPPLVVISFVVTPPVLLVILRTFTSCGNIPYSNIAIS